MEIVQAFLLLYMVVKHETGARILSQFFTTDKTLAALVILQYLGGYLDDSLALNWHYYYYVRVRVWGSLAAHGKEYT